MRTDASNPYVSRGGLKLAAALQRFQIDPVGWLCADLGCNVGGFTDCLLQHGAAHVLAVDTAYGEFAWKLRSDPCVTTLERTNALHLDPAEARSRLPEHLRDQPFDLIAIDLGWTPQRLALPAALRLRPRRIITLVKPHYERADLEPESRRYAQRHTLILTDAEAEQTTRGVLDRLPALGLTLIDHFRSPIRGGGSRKNAGNVEFLALLEPAV